MRVKPRNNDPFKLTLRYSWSCVFVSSLGFAAFVASLALPRFVRSGLPGPRALSCAVAIGRPKEGTLRRPPAFPTSPPLPPRASVLSSPFRPSSIRSPPSLPPAPRASAFPSSRLSSWASSLFITSPAPSPPPLRAFSRIAVWVASPARAPAAVSVRCVLAWRRLRGRRLASGVSPSLCACCVRFRYRRGGWTGRRPRGCSPRALRGPAAGSRPRGTCLGRRAAEARARAPAAQPWPPPTTSTPPRDPDSRRHVPSSEHRRAKSQRELGGRGREEAQEVVGKEERGHGLR